MPDLGAAGDLQEILDAADRITTYIAGLDEAAFLARRQIADAVAMNLLVIGEATRRIESARLAAEPGIPWSRVIAMRNRIAHGYSSLQFNVIWAIASRELPELRAAAARLLASG